ncbi:DUF2079 domain-containing protein [Candidatus Daviesbacteria bacterium]|nr:DUF2079 domain-containing protein [Candidatus Daviesbacteria bacterium]
MKYFLYNFRNFFSKNYIVLLILNLFFFLFYTYHSLKKHLQYDSHAFDLGIYTQSTYLYGQGIFYNTLKHMNLLGDHFGPILIFFAPLYRIFPSPVTLLIIQALFVSLASIPIYLVSLNLLKNKLLSFLVSLSYLTSIGVLTAINFDFHLATISVLPLSLIVYFWHFKRWKFYWITLVFSLLFKEDIPIFIFGLGLFQLLKKQRLAGISTLIFSVISFIFIKFFLMPLIWEGADQAYISTSILPLTSPLELIYLLIIRPGIFLDQLFNSQVKLGTFFALYKGFAFMPILSPFSWLAVFPYLYLRFTSSYIQMWGTEFHHNINLEPFLAYSAIFGIKSFNIPHKPVIILLLFFLFTSGLAPNSLIISTLQSKPPDLSRFNYINNGLKIIPKNSPVSAQSPIVPHLINREKIYLYPEILDSEYIVVDTSLAYYFMGPGELQQRLADLKQDQAWQEIHQEKSLHIFKRRVN